MGGGGGEGVRGLNLIVAFPGFPRISIIMLLSGPAAFFVDIEHEIYILLPFYSFPSSRSR